MAEKIALRTAVDVYVTSAQGATYGLSRIYVNSDAQAYLFFNLPSMPIGAQILSAVLQMTSGGDLAALPSGHPTVTVHTVTSAYDANRLTWANRPTESAAVDTKSAPVSIATDIWEFDVQPELAAAIAAGSWYGLTIKGNGAGTHYFWGSNSAQPMQLVITWTAPPATPMSLVPSNSQVVNVAKPTVSWNAGTAAGGERPYSLQVQVATNVNMVTGLWDSGEVLSSSNSLDLNTTSFPAITSGQTRFWRVRTKNTSTLWSAWSEVSSFSYVNPGAAVITSPGTVTAVPNPSMTWTFSPGTQQAFQVLVTGGQNNPTYDSGIVYTSTLAHQLPQGFWRWPNDIYLIELRVWDTTDRIGLPGAPTYSVVTKQVQFVPSGAPSNVQVVVDPLGVGYPHYLVKWQYTSGTPATGFAMVRWRYPGDPEPIIRWVTPAESAIPGQPTWYSYLDREVGGRTDATWTVRARTAAGVSVSDPQVTLKIDHIMPWVTSVSDYTRRFTLVNYTIDPGLSEVSDIVSPLNGPPSLVSQVLKGFIGTASGVLANGVVDGLSARQMKENLLWLRKHPHVYFVWADEAIQCYIYEVKYTTIPTADGKTDYGISFGFIETLRGA